MIYLSYQFFLLQNGDFYCDFFTLVLQIKRLSFNICWASFFIMYFLCQLVIAALLIMTWFRLFIILCFLGSVIRRSTCSGYWTDIWSATAMLNDTCAHFVARDSTIPLIWSATHALTQVIVVLYFHKCRHLFLKSRLCKET